MLDRREHKRYVCETRVGNGKVIQDWGWERTWNRRDRKKVGRGDVGWDNHCEQAGGGTRGERLNWGRRRVCATTRTEDSGQWADTVDRQAS